MQTTEVISAIIAGVVAILACVFGFLKWWGKPKDGEGKKFTQMHYNQPDPQLAMTVDRSEVTNTGRFAALSSCIYSEDFKKLLIITGNTQSITQNMLQNTDMIGKKLEDIEKHVNRLFDMHNVRDDQGSYIWYASKDTKLLSKISETLQAIRQLAESQKLLAEQQAKQMDRIMDKISK